MFPFWIDIIGTSAVSRCWIAAIFSITETPTLASRIIVPNDFDSFAQRCEEPYSYGMCYAFQPQMFHDGLSVFRFQIAATIKRPYQKSYTQSIRLHSSSEIAAVVDSFIMH